MIAASTRRCSLRRALRRRPAHPWRPLLTLAVCLATAGGAWAFIPEEAAILEREQILNAVEAARQQAPEDVTKLREQQRAERNARITQEMSRPPAGFGHFNRPRNPHARQQASRRIRESSAETPEIPGNSQFFSPVPSIVGVLLFGIVLALHAVLSRRNAPAPAAGNKKA